jgi:polysaccharide chain length determinant protein (PEP-CTERM system associated)
MRELLRLVEAPLRRPWLVVLPLLLTLGAAIGASFLLPPRYRSSMLILIAPEQMPTSLVPQAASEKVARRLQTLRQEVQSRTRLETVARDLDPYGTLAKEPLINTIERIRADVTVSVKGYDAFNIEYVHSDPQMAMRVVDRLTRLLLEDVAGTPQRQVSTAYQFIESQLQDARQQLEEKEAALRAYKERHMGQLPEQVPANLATLQRLQLEQQTLSESVRRATDTLLSLENTAPASAVVAPTTAPDDPLTGMKAALAQLRTRYTEAHPDVKALAARVELLEAAKRAERAERPPTPPPVDRAAIALAGRRRDAAIELQTLKARLADVDRRIAAFQARVDSAPRREQEILVLTRDYQKLSENYARLLTKKLDAEMAANLEQQQAGRQFRILDPANLPQQPSFPNRNRFALAGAIAGLLLGAGLAVLVDWLDPTLKDADEAAAVLGLPLLAVIPFVPPKQQRRLAAMRPAEAARAHNGTDFSRRRHAALTRTAAQHRGPESM